MKKSLSVLSLVLGLGLATTALTLPHEAAASSKPCTHKHLTTQMLKQACAKGGQRAAKKTMKAFVKKAKKAKGGDPDLACDSCHKKLGGNYPIKADALKHLQKLLKVVK